MSNCFSTSIYSSSSSAREFQRSASLPKLGMASALNFGHLTASRHGFNCISLITNEFAYPFTSLRAIWIPSSVPCLLTFFALKTSLPEVVKIFYSSLLESFTILPFTFRYIIQLKLIFVYGVRFIVFPNGYYLINWALLMEMDILSLLNVINQVTINVWVYFGALFSIPLFCLPLNTTRSQCCRITVCISGGPSPPPFCSSKLPQLFWAFAFPHTF